MTNSAIRTGIYYRTLEPKTAKIERDWSLRERSAFNNKPALSVADLMKLMPERALKPLGDFQPTDEVFRKLATGYGKVSEAWLKLGRMIGVWDFSVDQAAFIQVAVFLDSINVRVRPHLVVEDTNRANSIEYFCFGDPDYQGTIRYYGDRLAVPENLFERVLRTRLDVFKLYCNYLQEVLEIPGESDIKSLLLQAEKDANESDSIAVVDELETAVNHQLAEPSEDGESDGDDDTAEGEITAIFVVSESADSGVTVDEVYNNGEHSAEEAEKFLADEFSPEGVQTDELDNAQEYNEAAAETDSNTDSDSQSKEEIKASVEKFNRVKKAKRKAAKNATEGEPEGLGVDVNDFQSAVTEFYDPVSPGEQIADDERSGEAEAVTEEPYHDNSQEEANAAEDQLAERMADVYTDPSFANLAPPSENQQFGY